MSDTYIFQSKSQFTLMLLILDAGSICYMDSWVTRIIFRERINQNIHSKSIILTVKQTLFRMYYIRQHLYFPGY